MNLLLLLLACQPPPPPVREATPVPPAPCQAEGAFPATSAALVEAHRPALAACMAQTPDAFADGPLELTVFFEVRTDDAGGFQRGRTWMGAARPVPETTRCLDALLADLEQAHPELHPGAAGSLSCTFSLGPPK